MKKESVGVSAGVGNKKSIKKQFGRRNIFIFMQERVSNPPAFHKMKCYPFLRLQFQWEFPKIR